MPSPKGRPTPAPKFHKPPLGKPIRGPFQPNPVDTGNTFESDVIREVKKYTEPGFENPAVGDAHPDTEKYPDHKLIIPPIPEEDGETVQLIYARLRPSTDQEISEEFGGGVLDTLRSFDFTKLTPDQGYLVVKSVVEDLNDGRYRKDTTQLSEKDEPRIDRTNGGSGYTGIPTVTVSGGGAATAKIGKAVASIAINNAGHYDYPPAVYAVGDGYGFVGVAVLTGTNVSSVTIISGGVWATAPSILFVGGHQTTPAVATPTLATTGTVTEVTLTTPSTDVAPTVGFSGGGGSGAAATYHVPDVEWPELIGDDTDPTYGIVIDLSRKVVPGGTKYPGVPVSLVSPYVDIQPHSRWRSIQIVSKVDLRTLPIPITWGATHELDLPATLLDVTANWDKTGGITEIADVTPRFGAATAKVEISSGVLGSIEVLFRHNYRGPARAEVTRQFFFGPPSLSAIALITKIIPVTGTASLIGKHVTFGQSRGTSFNNPDPNLEDSNNGQLRTESKTFGPFLSGAVVSNTTTFADGATSAGASAGPDLNGDTFVAAVALPGSIGTLKVNIPVSTPTDINSGDWITISAEPENWRFGIFVVHTIRVQVP